MDLLGYIELLAVAFLALAWFPCHACGGGGGGPVVDDCTECCVGLGDLDDFDINVPAGFSNGSRCDGCDTIVGDYSLTTSVPSFYGACDGATPSLNQSCARQYIETGICAGSLDLSLTAEMRTDEGGCYWWVAIKVTGTTFESPSGTYCQNWFYESERSASGWDDCDTREWTLDRDDTADSDCYKTGPSGPCELCTDPPATITLTVAA